MGREFELKLEIPAASANKVMRLPWLWEQASGEMQPRQMSTTYYDTPKYALRQKGISLRVRRIGTKNIQTVKAVTPRKSCPIDRSEWEREIGGDVPELRHVLGTPLQEFKRKKLRKSLAPVFEVKVERSAYPVLSANSAIELAIDRGSVSTGDANAAFCEIELELKRGASAELARLARRLASEVPASLGLKTKADRGFDLRSDQAARVYRAEHVRVTARSRIGHSFKLIGWSCLRQFALNGDAIRAGNFEGVHQMRVGLRRLQTVLSIFEHLIDGPETDAVETELKWLIDELAPARDLDVFIEKTLGPLSAKAGADAALQCLLENVKARRALAMERARQAVSGDRFRQFVLRTALWLLAGEWSDLAELEGVRPEARIEDFARRTLERRTRKVARKLRAVRGLDIGARHKLRLAVKELRYTAEFFTDVFADARRDRRRFAKILAKLQDNLGRLNDLAVHRRLGQEFVEAWTLVDLDRANNASNENASPAVQYALGFAIGQEQHESDACADTAYEMGRRLKRAKRFWR
ncbi:MAG: CHAD domain-containing protein [Proteobacteria bacterium]|nr:CHAD domain-containing protein [Pseudomonadota bacterium]